MSVMGLGQQVAGLVFSVTAAVTMGVLWAARRWRLADVPNERSAHLSPTPTLGGIGISAGLAAGSIGSALGFLGEQVDVHVTRRYITPG